MKKWYNNGIDEFLIEETEIETKQLIPGRLKKIKKVELLKQKISKEELYKYYILENHKFTEVIEKYNIVPQGLLNQLLREYNIHKDPKAARKNNKSISSHENYIKRGEKSSLTQKEHWNKKDDLLKENWKQKCIISHSTLQAKLNMSKAQKETREKLKINNPEREQLMNKKRSETCKHIWATTNILERRNNTVKKNREKRKGSICKTIAEQKIYDTLIKTYPNLKYDEYIDDRYPYYVDFYIPEEDLFIEYQGFPSHGKIPYDKNNSKSLDECYKLYGKWLETYTITDPQKYETAKKNNLNFIRIYPEATLDENYKINKYKYTTIIKEIYTIS